MSVKIAHSSIDERGKASGGSAGDQTGKEVCTRSWYNGSWNVLIRPKTSALANRIVKEAKAGAANNKIGYDQNQRNTLLTQAKKVNFDLSKIATACECDCSSFVTVLAIAGGCDESKLVISGNCATTSTLRTRCKNTGKFDIYTDSKYLTSDAYLKAGDILVREGHHTVIVLENGSKATTSSSSGSKIAVDGEWGTDTTKLAQKVFGTTVDGKVSNQYKAYADDNSGLLSMTFEWETKPSGYSPLIKAIQKWCGATQDGHIGPDTIKKMQKKLGTPVDGHFDKGGQGIKAFQKWLNSQV